MLYNIVFNGASCRNVFHRDYKSDFHAVVEAGGALSVEGAAHAG